MGCMFLSILLLQSPEARLTRHLRAVDEIVLTTPAGKVQVFAGEQARALLGKLQVVGITRGASDADHWGTLRFGSLRPLKYHPDGVLCDEQGAQWIIDLGPAFPAALREAQRGPGR